MQRAESRHLNGRDNAQHRAPVGIAIESSNLAGTTVPQRLEDELRRARRDAAGRERLLAELAELPDSMQVAMVRAACTSNSPDAAVESMVAILLPDAENERILAVAGAFRTDDSLREQLTFAWEALRRIGTA